MILTLPKELIYNISECLDLKSIYKFSICNKEINNEIIDLVYLKKFKEIKIKMYFALFKECIVRKQVATFIQTIIQNQLTIQNI